jgi:hypothetical protein
VIEKITEAEIEFMEALNDPIAFAECVFSNVDNLGEFDEDKFSEVRLPQFSMMSYEYLLDTEDPTKSPKENFKQREATGTVHCYGGRKYGKTKYVEQVDLLEAMCLNENEKCGFSSFDAMHIRGVLEDIITALENHPFFSLFEARINRSPTYRIYLKNGFCLDGINMNLSGDEPGGQFFQKHLTRLYMEEASFETEKVFAKRLDAISEFGCIERFAGMTNFTKHSPAGKVFYDLKKRHLLVNYPQYVSHVWGPKERERAIKEHGGEDSISYRIFVKGEVVEDGISAMDMERVRKNYNDKKTIKHFEVTKENFPNFEYMLIIEKPSNAEGVYIAADIGENVTEIIVMFQVSGNYQYRYNITCYNLTDKEQFKILKFLGSQLQANFIGLDTTDGMGRAIFRSLEEVFPKENLVWCAFNEKIKIGIDKDDKGNDIFKDGKPVYKEEYVDGWSIKRLRDLLYEEGKIDIPMDYKLDVQLNSIIVTQSGNRTLYTCCHSEDHLLAAWRVFAIAEWLNYMTINKPIRKKVFAKSGI